MRIGMLASLMVMATLMVPGVPMVTRKRCAALRLACHAEPDAQKSLGCLDRLVLGGMAVVVETKLVTTLLLALWQLISAS